MERCRRIANSNRLADVGVHAAEARYAIARRDARLEEAKYWLVVALAEKDRTLQAYQDMLAELEREAEDAVAAGLSTRNDLLEVRLERGNAAVQRLDLESARRLAARDLRRFLGLHEGEDIVLADAVPREPVRPVADHEAETAAVSRRLEIELLRWAVEAERIQERLERGEGLPTVSLGAAVLRHDFSGLESQGEALVFATVSVPITDGWSAKHKAGAARQRQRVAQLRLDDAGRLIAQEIARTWDDFDAAWGESQVADLGVEQAEVNLVETGDGYERGLVTLSDLLEAQTLLQQATGRRIDARISLVLRRSAYLRAIAVE